MDGIPILVVVRTGAEQMYHDTASTVDPRAGYIFSSDNKNVIREENGYKVSSLLIQYDMYTALILGVENAGL